MDLNLKPLLSKLRHNKKNKQGEFGGFNAFLDISRQFCAPLRLNDVSLQLNQFHLGPGTYTKSKYENYHIHNELQLEYIIEGQFKFQNAVSSRVLNCSDGIAILPFDSHRWKCCKTGIMVGVMLDVVGKNRPGFLEYLQAQQKGQFAPFSGVFFQDTMAQILELYFSGNLWKAEQAGNLLHIFLSQSLQKSFRLNQWVTSAAVPCSSEKNSKMCQWAINFIAANYPSKLTVNMIATHLGISSRHLIRIFAAQRGETITDAIMRIRLEQANDMLKYQDKAIKNIAYCCGFSSPAYFTFCYKKKYGVPPSLSQVSLV